MRAQGAADRQHPSEVQQQHAVVEPLQPAPQHVTGPRIRIEELRSKQESIQEGKVANVQQITARDGRKPHAQVHHKLKSQDADEKIAHLG